MCTCLTALYQFRCVALYPKVYSGRSVSGGWDTGDRNLSS